MKKIAITTGDPDGIGTEVTAKALLRLGPSSKAQFYIFHDGRASSEKWFRLLNKKFRRIVCSSLEEALEHQWPKQTVIEIVDGSAAPDWVETAAVACHKKDLDGMVTGPLSKTLIKKSGRKEMGHTEILQKIARVKNVYQGYLGEKFCVVLMTAHLPLKNVAKALNKNLIQNSLRAAFQLRQALPSSQRRKPVALMGLNPHAGEEGLLGREEGLLRRSLEGLHALRKQVAGPLVPDAAFSPENWQQYSVYVACYHDQGLIPFKMIHGKSSGSQISLGLPFIRTSVDHGTAKDIAGKGIAEAGSMFDAIQWCLRLS